MSQGLEDFQNLLKKKKRKKRKWMKRRRRKKAMKMNIVEVRMKAMMTLMIFSRAREDILEILPRNNTKHLLIFQNRWHPQTLRPKTKPGFIGEKSRDLTIQDHSSEF